MSIPTIERSPEHESMMLVGGKWLYSPEQIDKYRDLGPDLLADYSSDDYCFLRLGEKSRARREWIVYGTGPYARVHSVIEMFPELDDELERSL